MSKGTILYVGGFELPDKNAAAHRVLNNARIFKKLGYKVVFIGVSNQVQQNTKYYHENFEIIDRPYPRSVLDWIKHMVSISVFRDVISHFDDIKLVICYNAPALATLRLKMFLSNVGIKIAGDFTEWYGGTKINSLREFVSRIDTEIRMRLIAKKLDGLIVISHYLKKYYNKKDNVLLVPPLVDKTESIWSKNQIINFEDKIKFIYAGNAGQKDRIDQIIKAFSILNNKNHILTIIGLTKEEFLRTYGLEMNDHLIKLDSNVVFLGWKTHKETIQNILGSDIYIFYRYRTKQNRAGFPTKFVEATSCKTPVLTTNVGDLKLYIESGVNGILLDKFDQDGLVDILGNLRKNEVINMKSKIDDNLFDNNNFIYDFEKWLVNMKLN